MPLRPLSVLTLAFAMLVLTATTAAAQTDPGDFIVDISPGEPPADVQPKCSPDLTTLGVAVIASGSASTDCEVSTSLTQKKVSGTASNPTLAASTGDAGFNTGMVAAVCDASTDVSFVVKVSMTSTSVTGISGTSFQACSFTMSFQDAAKSTLSGTIEANAVIDGTAVTATISLDIDATVYITGGTGYFSGYVGDGTFAQTQTFAIPTAPSSGAGGSSGGPTGGSVSAAEQAICDLANVPAGTCSSAAVTAACTAAPPGSPLKLACTAAGKRLAARRLAVRQGATAGNPMKLKLVKKPGRVRILAPAPPTGKRTKPAVVKAKSVVRLAATTGAVCTVRTNAGAFVGTGTAKGPRGAVTIRPKAGAYVKAKSIKATCTKGGKSFSSNTVKVILG